MASDQQPSPPAPSNPPPQPPNTPSSMPVVALVLSVFGFCLPPLLLVGIVLGVVSLLKKKGSQTAAIISVVLPVAALPVMGILAAIAIPNFLKFQARARQSECKANLKAVYTGEQALYAERQVFSTNPTEVGFTPDPGHRYYYFFSEGAPAFSPKVANAPAGAVPQRIPPELRRAAGLHGRCPDCSVTVLCAGNVDGDDAIDVWSISTADRPGIPQGALNNDVNDLAN